MVPAAVGFIFSLAIHVFALCGLAPQSQVWIVVLFGGAAASWLLAAFVSGAEAGRMGAIPIDEILSDCPNWLKKSVHYLFSYAVLIFLWSVLRGMGLIPLKEVPQPSPETFAIFSGWSMAFYAGAYAMLFESLRWGPPVPFKIPRQQSKT
jgi:hypothetical protein